MWKLPRSPWVLFLAIFAFFAALLGIRPLSVPDEGRYGDISRWMWLSHDYLVPRIDGVPFLHKPPLLHWLTTGLLQLFGQHVWVLRLVSTLAALLILVSMYRFAHRYIHESVARWSVVILATSLIFFGASQYVNHDMLVACWITLTLFNVADFVLSGNKKALFIAVVCAGLGFLSKGLIGILIPGMVMLPWLLYIKAWRKIPAILNPLGLALLVAIVLPWPYLLNQSYAGFLHYFFIEQQFDRFSSSGFNNQQPWFFYISCLVLSFLPWLVLIKFNVAGKAVRSQLPTPIFALLAWWSLSCLVFFSIPPSKLVGYILPMVAPLALLIATAITHLGNAGARLKAWQRYFAPVYLLIVALAIAFMALTKPASLVSPQYVPLACVLSGMVVIAAVSMMVWQRQKFLANQPSQALAITKTTQATQTTLLATVLLCVMIAFCVKWFDKKNNADQVSFASLMTPQTQMVFYDEYFYDLPWLLNLQRPAYVVKDWTQVNRDNSFMELKDGTRFEPAARQYLIDKPTFNQLISSHQPLIVVTNKGENPPFAASATQKLVYRNYDVYVINP